MDTNFYTIYQNDTKVGWIRATTRFSAVRDFAAAEGISEAGLKATSR